MAATQTRRNRGGTTRHTMLTGQSMSTRTRDRMRRDAYNGFRRVSNGGNGG
jgi:hypothetical protein